MEKYAGMLASFFGAFWDSLPEPVKAAVFGTLIAWVRVLYDDKEPRRVRRLLEGFLCGAIALAVASGVEAAGLSSNAGTFIGGTVGLFGADKVREWANAVAQRKVDKS